MRVQNWTLGVMLAAVSLSAVPAQAQSPGGLVPTGPRPDVALVYTGDVIGYLDPCG